MKKLVRLVSLLFVLILSVGVFACGGDGDSDGGSNSGDSSKTEINVLCFKGTAGSDWVVQAGKRFAELHKDTVYQDGKKGVYISASEQEATVTETELGTDGNDIYVFENKPNIYLMKDKLLDLTEVVTANNLESRMNSNIKGRVKIDGSYYALPSFEWYNGISYDIDYFESKNLYFADGSSNFITSKTDKKSCGPDGVYDTSDDGLPSSLEEFCKLCVQIGNVGGNPFMFAGKSSVYSFYLTDGLWASLAGYDKFNTVYTNYTTEPVEVVKRDANNNYIFTNDNLFNGYSTEIKVPETEMVVIDDSNYYRMYDMVEHYYGLAFLQLCIEKGWFNQKALKNSECTAFDAQDYFLNGKGDMQGAMLIDASYWYHEAKDLGYVKNASKNVSIMPLPTQLSGSVAEGNGKTQTLVDNGAAVLYANKKAETNGKKQAVIDFIKFLYTDSELKNFTETTGLTIPIDNYGYDTSTADKYYQNLANVKKESKVLTFGSDNIIFKQNQASFTRYYSNHVFTFGGTDYANVGYRDAMIKGVTAKDIFNALKKNQTV